jgi:putative transcriptional regulator
MVRKNEFFEDIREGLCGVIDAIDKGRLLTQSDIEIPEPNHMTAQEIAKLRIRKCRVSQQVFAQLVNVAPQTVQAWEQGRNTPSGATLRLLRLFQTHPGVVADLMCSTAAAKTRRKSGRSTLVRCN